MNQDQASASLEPETRTDAASKPTEGHEPLEDAGRGSGAPSAPAGEPVTLDTERDTTGEELASGATDTVTAVVPTAVEDVSSDRWHVAVAIGLALVTAGLLVQEPAVFLAAVVPLTYVAYGSLTGTLEPDIRVERTLEPAHPSPGDDVSVTVTVTNDSDVMLPDVRVADQPPADLSLEGEPQMAASLEGGASCSTTYRLRAARGAYDFGDTVVDLWNISQSERRIETYSLEQSFDCDDALERLPLDGQTIHYTGRVETNIGGEGIEFHSTRPFQASDPMRRVDWKRFARTGRLSTVDFREERAAAVVIVVDARRLADVVRNPGELDGRTLSFHATTWLARSLLAANNRVGVALYGGRGDYLLPRSGRDQLARVERLLEGDWCGSFGRPSWLANGDGAVTRFCRDLADDKQILFVTPVLDDEPVSSAKRFRAFGHDVTVVSPMIASGGDRSGRLEQLQHEARLSTLRSHGVHVIDWDPDESLHVAVERHNRRRNR